MEKFNLFVPIEIEKSGKTGEDRYNDMRFKGIASNPNMGRDKQNQWLDPSGFLLDDLVKSGQINYHHLWKDKPLAIIGEPTLAKVTKNNELYLEGKLYKGSQIARDVYDLAELLEANSDTRRLGFSIEGIPLEVDKKDKNKILKARITNVAITPSPVCPGTMMELMKGGLEDLQFDDKDFLIDIVGQDGCRYTVDRNLNIEKSVVDDEIEKGGEGSKGGKIIGHTKSGKPIYETHTNKVHQDFSKKDHEDASDLHEKIGDTHWSKYVKDGDKKAIAASKHHTDQMEMHHSFAIDQRSIRNRDSKKESAFKKAMVAGAITGTETTNQSLTQEPLKPESVEGGKKKKKKKVIKDLLSKGEVFTELISEYNMDIDSCKRVFELASAIEKGRK